MTLHSSDAHMQYPLNNSQKYCMPCTQNYHMLSLRTHKIFTFEIWQQVALFASNTFEQRKHVGSQNRVKIFVSKIRRVSQQKKYAPKNMRWLAFTASREAMVRERKVSYESILVKEATIERIVNCIYKDKLPSSRAVLNRPSIDYLHWTINVERQTYKCKSRLLACSEGTTEEGH